MKDGVGRIIDYLRISVTDRCNLRCTYCMPQCGMNYISHEEVLRYEEIERLCCILAEQGLRKIKLTGGEPLVRKGIDVLVHNLKRIEGIESVTLTTNGILLSETYDSLVDAGLDAVTVSLDTVNPQRYSRLTLHDSLDRVLEGIHMAQVKGRIPLKLNCVLLPDLEKEDVFGMLRLCENAPTDLRFIERMPIGPGKDMGFLAENQIRQWISEKYGPLLLYTGIRGNGPCTYWSVSGLTGKIGFISAISHSFCGSCNRLRLTADGWLKPCLQYDYGSSMKKLLRSGASDHELWNVMQDIIQNKPESHHFTENTEKNQDVYEDDERLMSQIGG